MKTGTLKELNVKPGDVVKYAGNRQYEVLPDRKLVDKGYGKVHNYDELWSKAPYFTIVSRAQEASASLPRTPDLPHGHVTLPDGRTVDLTANRVRCDLMDADELQAMKDHGGPWEMWFKGKWPDVKHPSWHNYVTYRVTPKPVVETVVLHGNLKDMRFTETLCCDDTHSIAITIQDGKIIDTKTEEL